MYKTIEVEFCEEQIEVKVELFNHDDKVEISIESATKDDVDVLGMIEILGGYTELVAVVEKN